ncbi:hypothetical protein DSECCO2_636930 [anaerobic digester metagenome]
MLDDLVHGQVEGAGIDQSDAPRPDQVVDSPCQGLARRLFEGDDHARFAPSHAFDKKCRGEDGLA